VASLFIGAGVANATEKQPIRKVEEPLILENEPTVSHTEGE
jgi:hypothetical protein